MPDAVVSISDHPEAPCLVIVDARPIVSDARVKCEWSFGDKPSLRNDPRAIFEPTKFPQVDANSAMQGLVSAHLYENSGIYTISLKVTDLKGVVSNYSYTIRIEADARPKTVIDGSIKPASLASLLSKASQRIQVAAPINVDSTITIGSNTILEGINGKPMISGPSGGPMFITTPGSRDVIVRNLSFTSPYHIIPDAHGYLHAECGSSEAMKFRGSRIAFLDCDLHCLNRGIEIPDNSADSILIQGVRQLYAIESQVLSIWGGSRIVVAFCHFRNSYAESTVRVDNRNAADGFSFIYNYVAQDIDPKQSRALAKACLVIRNAKDWFAAFNSFENSEVSTSPAGTKPIEVKAAGTAIRNGLMKSNMLRSTKSPCFFHIGQTTQGLEVRDNWIQRDNGPATTVSPDGSGVLPMEDIFVHNNTITGKNVREVQIDHADGSGLLPNVKFADILKRCRVEANKIN